MCMCMQVQSRERFPTVGVVDVDEQTEVFARLCCAATPMRRFCRQLELLLRQAARRDPSRGAGQHSREACGTRDG